MYYSPQQLIKLSYKLSTHPYTYFSIYIPCLTLFQYS